jgi:hypothetical protein
MSWPSKEITLKMSRWEEDRLNAAVAESGPDALPLAADQMGAMVSLSTTWTTKACHLNAAGFHAIVT